MTSVCRPYLLLLGILCAVAGVPRALAQTPPMHPEFQINTVTTGDERHPTVIVGPANGSFGIAWQRPGAGGPDVVGNGFDSDGTPNGDEGLINTFTTGGQSGPKAAGNLNSHIVVVWMSGGQDGSFTGIFGQRFDNNGALGGEFQVNTYTTGYQYSPTVAVDSSGNFVVVWQAGSQAIYGLRFTP